MPIIDWSDDEELSDAEWRDYHLKCCREGDGWSHGFTSFDWSQFDKMREYIEAKGDKGGIFIVYEPNKDVVKHFTMGNWMKMGDAICCHPHWKFVDLSHCVLSAEGIDALFGPHHRSYDRFPLEKLTLDHNPLGPAGAAALLPFLQARGRLKYLSLIGVHLGTEGARIVSEALDTTEIDFLNVRDNSIGDEGVEHLLSARHSRCFFHLCLTENPIGPRGYRAISNFLRRSDTLLTKFSMSCDDRAYARSIIDSISPESNLYDVFLWGGDVSQSNDSMILALPNVQKLIYNDESLETLIASNHRIMSFGINTDAILAPNPMIGKLLDINARFWYKMYDAKEPKVLANSKHNALRRNFVVRCKLRRFYFRGQYCIKPLARMDVKLIPHVLEIMTRDEVCQDKEEGYIYFGKGTYTEVCSDNLSGVYRLIRNSHLPELVSYAQRGSVNAEEVVFKANDTTQHQHEPICDHCDALKSPRTIVEKTRYLSESHVAMKMPTKDEVRVNDPFPLPNKRPKNESKKIERIGRSSWR